MIGFARGSRRPSFNPFGRSVRAQLPPAPAVSGVARWGGVPSRSRRGVPPSPARLAAWPLGAWPARSAPALPVSRWRGRGLAWPWGASRPGARGPLPALRPWGRPVVSVGVVSRGVRPAGARAVLRRGVPRTTTPRRGWSLVRPSGARGVRRGPCRPRWGVVGRPSRPRWGVVVAWRPWPFRGGPAASPVGGVPWPWGAGPCARCPRPSRRGVVPVSRRPASPVGAWRGVRCQ